MYDIIALFRKQNVATFIFQSGFSGSFPGDETPWPLSGDGISREATPVKRRFEYTAFSCPDSANGAWYIYRLLDGNIPIQFTN